MAIKPILFNTEMVKAILDGRKTVTRRCVKPKQIIGLGCDKCPNNLPKEYIREKKMLFKPYCDMTDNELINAIYKEPFQPGDILYVRETWTDHYVPDEDGKPKLEYCYKADGIDIKVECLPGENNRWYSSIHMPKEAARLWLKVTDVRVEQLNDITVEECKKEGIWDDYRTLSDEYHDMLMEKAYPETFGKLWNSTVKKFDRYGWDANPWVWAIEFERCEKLKDNYDDLPNHINERNWTESIDELLKEMGCCDE